VPLNHLANLLTNYFDVVVAVVVVVISPVRMVVSPHALTSFLDSDFLILNLNFDFVGPAAVVKPCHCVNDGWIKVQNGTRTRYQVRHYRVVTGLQRNLRGLS